MKKLIALCLSMIMLISVLNLTAGAKTDNLLINGDIEIKTLAGWKQSGPNSKIEVSKDAAHNGGYGISVTERTGRYSTVAQDLYETFFNNGAGKYRASVWLRLKDAGKKAQCQLVISYTAGGQGQKWITSAVTSLTDQWQEYVIEKDLNINIYELETMFIYPQVESGEENLDFYMDDATFAKISPVTTPDPNYVKDETVKNATTDNLIENGGFEMGDEDGFTPMGIYDADFDEEYARTGEYGMQITSRQTQYTTVTFDLMDTFWDYGQGSYRASVWVRLDNEIDMAKNIKCELVIRYNLKGQSIQYITSGKKTLTTQWQQFIIDRPLDFNPENVSSMLLYPQVLGANDSVKVDFCVDDFTLHKTSEVIPPSEDMEKIEDIKVEKVPMNPIDVSNVDREPVTSVGVIRWDAWYGHDGISGSVISAVEKTLSPAEFHFRAPFFAEVTEAGGITIPAYTQEIFDKEMEYAIEAGIDYFAFLWYSDGMQAARKLYQTSKYNDKVKMCIILGGGDGTAEQHQEMAKLLKEDYYMTVLGGRPLMFYDCGLDAAKTQIEYYRGLCKLYNIPEPYAVCLKLKADQKNLAVGDAIGDYAISNGSKNITFKELTAEAELRWRTHQRSGSQYVPLVTTGYHLLPRYKNQVSWMNVTSDKVAEYATAEEIGAHLTAALEYMQTPEVAQRTKINTVLMYAWNEHDEGGWLCPTLKVDENGNQLYGENGEKLIDTSRIEAVKGAISAYKASVNTGNSGNQGSTGTDQPNAQNSKTWIYIAVAGAAVVIIGAVAVVIIIKKRKNGNEQ